MREHLFPDTGSAYDATQCDEDIRDGDLLICERSGVVGVAYTWPFAVTAETGDLHGMTGVDNIASESDALATGITLAVEKAMGLGFAVNPVVQTWYDARA